MKNLRQQLMQITGFILISTVLGMSAQKVLPHGISLKTDLTLIETDSGTVSIPSVSINPKGNAMEASAISLKQAYSVFSDSSAIFIDARTLEEFEAGHIKGAAHIPVEAFMDSIAFFDTLQPDQLIITYCDGADCNASIDLAGEISVMGFSNVYFFFGGWQEWLNAGYPIESTSGD